MCIWLVDFRLESFFTSFTDPTQEAIMPSTTKFLRVIHTFIHIHLVHKLASGPPGKVLQ